ncbi:hypothetical protein GCM10029963_12190 [Micromonospora andamanensis]
MLAALSTLAAGNPQALVDLADSLTPGQWHGTEPLPTTPPADGELSRAYRSMLSRLPDDTRRALLLAALAATAPVTPTPAGPGHAVDPVTLGRALRAAGGGVAALAPAEAAGLIRLTAPGGAVFPRPLARVMVEATASSPRAARRICCSPTRSTAPGPGCVGRCTWPPRPTVRTRRWPPSWRTRWATRWTGAPPLPRWPGPPNSATPRNSPPDGR